MLLGVVSFLFFSSFSIQAMDTHLFYERNKHALENPNCLKLPDYLQKLHSTISKSPDWQNFLANPHQAERASQHIARMSCHIHHTIVAAVVLATSGSHQWAQAYIQKNSLALATSESHQWTQASYIQRNSSFPCSKLSNFLNEVILIPEVEAQPIIQQIIALDIKPTTKLMITAISNDKLQVLNQLSKRGVTQISTINKALYYAIQEAKIKAVEVLINNHVDMTIKNINGQTPLEYAQSEQTKTINNCHKEQFKEIINLLKAEPTKKQEIKLIRKQVEVQRITDYCPTHSHLTQLPIFLTMQRH